MEYETKSRTCDAAPAHFHPRDFFTLELFHPRLVSQVVCGDMHTLTLSTDGAVTAWGGGESGQVGDGDGRNSK